jgi:hypothetical protein
MVNRLKVGSLHFWDWAKCPLQIEFNLKG